MDARVRPAHDRGEGDAVGDICHGTRQKGSTDRFGRVAEAFAILEKVLLESGAARSATPSERGSESPAPTPGF